MPYSLTKADQESLLSEALTLTNSKGWHDDAIAFAAKRDDEVEPRAIGVFQNFASGCAELHFATIGKRLSKELLEAYLFVSFHERALRLKRLFVPIPISNVAAQRAALGVGFQIEYRNRATDPSSEDMVVFSLNPVFEEPQARSSAA